MEEWIEIEGKSKDDALERACNALNTNRSHLEFEMLQEGNRIVKIRARKTSVAIAGAEPAHDDEADEVADEAAEAVAMGGEKDGGPDIEAKPTQPAVPVDPLFGQKAEEALTKIIRFVDENATVERKETSDSVFLEMFADNAALLIGKHGQTLSAIQYLVSKIVGGERNAGKRIVVDSEQYRARRQESLEGLARKMASNARRSGRPASAEPMNAAERRILHMALAEDPNVTTKSVGEGMSRRVLVVPRDGRGQGGGRGGEGRGDGGGGGGRSRGGSRDHRSGRPGPSAGTERRRSGPPARLHDSFDTPPDPEVDFFEEDPDAPVMADQVNGEEAPVQEGAPEKHED